MSIQESFQRYEELKKMAFRGEPRPPTDAERAELADLLPHINELKDFLGIEREWWNRG